MKIECQNVWKFFGDAPKQTTPQQDVSLGITNNQFITLVGASGCAKSSLLCTLAGLKTHSQGEVLVEGKAITGPGQGRAVPVCGPLSTACCCQPHPPFTASPPCWASPSPATAILVTTPTL